MQPNSFATYTIKLSAYGNSYEFFHNGQCVQHLSDIEELGVFEGSSDVIETDSSFNGYFIIYDQKKRIVAHIPMKDGKADGAARFVGHSDDFVGGLIVELTGFIKTFNGNSQGDWSLETLEIEYVNGIKNGQLKSRYGSIFVESHYKNGKLHGVERCYGGGKLESETTYVEGEKQLKTLFQDGSKYKEIPFVHGKIDGDVLWYSDDGDVTDVDHYVNGKLLE
ncbi:hypothetical protein AGMMS49545_00790 [Betaproteobacteria bacterium]|nr:hypothetical protein AGMMS49545_00790 [Betaproteobacteria bacterium]GHU40619.1 hypothetical protein AGMMS50289_02440 [Betaproteobacteria bacterium]